MRVIITGGSGLIGRELTTSLAQVGHEVYILSRNPEKVTNLPVGAYAVAWDGKTTDGWGELAEETDATVNLAGENIAGESLLPKRWTADRKRYMRDSRLDAGKAILTAIEAAERKPAVLIQSAAIGYYGPRGNEKLDEDSPPGNDFFAEFCQEWEQVTAAVEDLGVRRVIIRSGVVFSTEGGALPRLMLPFKLHVGGHFGSGKQFVSWIHIADEVGAIRFLIENNEAHGIYNLTAPDPITNADVAKALSKVMKRPNIMPIPGFAIKLAFGEVTTVVLDGQRVIPKRLLEAGYVFQFPKIENALQDLLGR